MFNHVRTLLLNDDGRNSPGPTFPGEEGVPAEYRRVAPPGAVRAVRNELFGTDPDRFCLNYRLREYMGLLHATELAEHVYGFDPRVTYRPAAWRPDDFPFAPAAEGSARPIYFAGAFAADEGRGRWRAQWRVSYAGPTATVLRVTPPVSEQEYEVTTELGVTSEVPLDAGLRCYFDATPGSFWHVTAAGRPTRGLPDVAERVAALGEERMIQLFGVNPPEPYKTFRALWYDHPFLPMRLGGLLLAVASRTHEAWRKET